MTSKPRHDSDVRSSSTRALTALWLSAVLIVGGVPGGGAVRASSFEPATFEMDDVGACGISAADAVRFLEQGSFGPMFVTDQTNPNYVTSVQHVMQDVCIEGWIQEQFNMPVVYPDDPGTPAIGTNYAYPGDPGGCLDVSAGGAGAGICWSAGGRPDTCTNNNGNTCARDNYQSYLLQNQFFVNALTGPDQLRQRVAWALSEIDVVSQLTIDKSSWMTPYMQLFDRNAFGNYRQLLYDLTVNPAMGEYLNMRGNNWSPSRNEVNENYAREILQLFSIGLNELNDDGTVRVDGSGNPIATYGQETIAAFAHVFTGWNLQTQLAPGVANYRDPMIVPSPNNHDPNPQTLLGNTVVQGAAETELGGRDHGDGNNALDNIFDHHNLGPFIGKQLIQKLVTSNPSPQYVQRVTTAFNTGRYQGQTLSFGSGQRGDMQATIAAILLDAEARGISTDAVSTYGHLREPVLFITNTLRATGGALDAQGDVTTDYVLGEEFLPNGAGTNIRMDQDVYRAPTVFSYYPPDNQVCPPGNTCPPDNFIFAPEFAIQSTSTALAHYNMIYDLAYHKMPLNARDRPTGTWIDTAIFEPEAVGDASALLDDLNLRLMHGTMTDQLRGVVSTAVQNIPETDPTGRVQEAIYLIASSSQYQVER